MPVGLSSSGAPFEIVRERRVTRAMTHSLPAQKTAAASDLRPPSGEASATSTAGGPSTRLRLRLTSSGTATATASSTTASVAAGRNGARTTSPPRSASAAAASSGSSTSTSSYALRSRRALTDTSSSSSPLSSSANAAGDQQQRRRQGLIHCVCSDFFRSLHDALIECVRCRNWCHSSCVDLAPAEVRQARATFVCPHCTGDAARKRKRAVSDRGASGAGASSRALAKLIEVPDKLPANPLRWRRCAEALSRICDDLNVEIVDLPNNSFFTDAVVEECMACCELAIRDATFSESYPRYCLNEMRTNSGADGGGGAAAGGNPYLQGCVLRRRLAGSVGGRGGGGGGYGAVVALVLSNGMDPYGNIKATVAHHRPDAHWQQHATPEARARHDALIAGIRASGDVSDMVHFTLIATHVEHRGNGFAKILMAREMIKWALRGRTRAYLNMALEKRADENGKVVCRENRASHRLYEVFGFLEISPKHTADGSFRWTPKEADTGRVMANADFTTVIEPVVEALSASTANGAKVHKPASGKK